MRKWFVIFMMLALMAFPSLAFAQFGVTLTNVDVQLWPEYDQPSMLVIVDYSVPENTPLPVDVTFRIPEEANLIAVAVHSADGSLLTANVKDPQVEGEWEVFTVTLDAQRGRFEYYQPMSISGEQRTFSFLWDNAYNVEAFTISVLEPLDVTSLTTTPKLETTTQQQGLKYYSGAAVKLAANEKFVFSLEYNKTSSALVASAPSPSVQPAEPLNDTTAGRVSFSNSLPYILGGVGLLLIVGGGFYFWQSSSAGGRKSRRRSRSAPVSEGGEIYCAQCGSRARGNDRFCRTCGSRIRQSDD